MLSTRPSTTRSTRRGRSRRMTRMKWTARLFALVLAGLLLTTGVFAQTSIGTVEGTVKDEQGAILPGATVTLTGPRGAQTTTTDDKGQFRFVAVQPGVTYALKVELGTSFAPQTLDVPVSLGKTATVDFTPKVAS